MGYITVPSSNGNKYLLGYILFMGYIMVKFPSSHGNKYHGEYFIWYTHYETSYSNENRFFGKKKYSSVNKFCFLRENNLEVLVMDIFRERNVYLPFCIKL